MVKELGPTFRCQRQGFCTFTLPLSARPAINLERKKPRPSRRPDTLTTIASEGSQLCVNGAIKAVHNSLLVTVDRLVRQCAVLVAKTQR